MFNLENHCMISSYFFFFNDTATTEIYTLSLHDALPIYRLYAVIFKKEAQEVQDRLTNRVDRCLFGPEIPHSHDTHARSEEHTSELQSRLHLVCRLLLEKKKKKH